jgi:hypothetical protein
LIAKTVSGALAVERRRTTLSAAKRERQALLRRAALCFRRAVLAKQRVQRSGSTMLTALIAARRA